MAVRTERDHVLGVVSATISTPIELLDFEVRVATLGNERYVFLAALSETVSVRQCAVSNGL